MAIDLCSESFVLVMSPRISFSHDLCQTDLVPIEHDQRRLDSSILESSSDFDFCIRDSFEQESSSADELFSDGKILPLQKIRKKTICPKQFHQSKPLPPLNPTPKIENPKRESLKEILASSSDFDEKTSSKSFWGFKRSSSCGNGYKRSSIFSLSLLSRSNSTGSALNPKRPPLSKDNNQSRLQKNPSTGTTKSSSFPSYYYSQRQPLKNSYGLYGNGVRISPVLNVPPPYFSKGTLNLFSFGSLFCNGKRKNKKKKKK